jgi:exopolyphosphatase / guanosine-5'-triphosphate,3'-diphosphate pyrophosphatase
VLTSAEEARLSFVGATRTLPARAEGPIAVADVGGGSTEVAIGASKGRVSWSRSFGVGSGVLADSFFESDPPSLRELEAARRHIAGALEGLDPPAAGTALAVGGTATSLHRLVGSELSRPTLGRAIRLLSVTPIAQMARDFALDPERVRLLPGGILLLEALSERLRQPLRIARGGLREGVVLELIDGGRR